MSTPQAAGGRPRGFDEETVLDRATEVFWRHGYEGTSLTTLTSAMGINRPSLYATFGSKEQLFERAFARYRDTQLARVRDALDRPTAREAVETFLRSSVDGLTDDEHPLGCLSVQGGLACSPDNPHVSQVLAAGRAANAAAVEERLVRAATEGDLPAGVDPRGLARFVAALSEGFAVQAAAGADRAELQAAVDVALRALLPTAG